MAKNKAKSKKKVTKKAGRAKSAKKSTKKEKSPARTGESKKSSSRGKPSVGRQAKGKSIYDRLRKESDTQKRGGRGGGEFWQPSKGRSTVRVFTFEVDGEEELFVEDVRHWQIEEGNIASNTACGGEDCPLCALKQEVDDKIWKKISPRRKYLFNAVVRDHPDGGDKQVIMRLGVKAKTQLIDLLGDPDFEGALDPQKGRDFKITRSGEGLQTSYLVVPMTNKSPIGVDVKPVDLTKIPSSPDEEALGKYAELIIEW